jgi:hypothetical protein
LAREERLLSLCRHPPPPKKNSAHGNVVQSQRRSLSVSTDGLRSWTRMGLAH